MKKKPGNWTSRSPHQRVQLGSNTWLQCFGVFDMVVSFRSPQPILFLKLSLLELLVVCPTTPSGARNKVEFQRLLPRPAASPSVRASRSDNFVHPTCCNPPGAAQCTHLNPLRLGSCDTSEALCTISTP